MISSACWTKPAFRMPVTIAVSHYCTLPFCLCCVCRGKPLYCTLPFCLCCVCRGKCPQQQCQARCQHPYQCLLPLMERRAWSLEITHLNPAIVCRWSCSLICIMASAAWALFSHGHILLLSWNRLCCPWFSNKCPAVFNCDRMCFGMKNVMSWISVVSKNKMPGRFLCKEEFLSTF